MLNFVLDNSTHLSYRVLARIARDRSSESSAGSVLLCHHIISNTSSFELMKYRRMLLLVSNFDSDVCFSLNELGPHMRLERILPSRPPQHNNYKLLHDSRNLDPQLSQTLYIQLTSQKCLQHCCLVWHYTNFSFPESLGINCQVYMLKLEINLIVRNLKCFSMFCRLPI